MLTSDAPYCPAGRDLDRGSNLSARSMWPVPESAKQPGLVLLVRADDRRIHYRVEGIATVRSIDTVTAEAGYRPCH